ncbi:MAG: ABC transporter permease [Candidatus Thorarchaeota archaeon]
MMAASGASVHIHVGSKLSLIAYDDQLVEFEVVGVFSSKSKIFSYELIITDMDSARRLLGVENGTCTDIAVWIEPGRDLNSVAFRLDNAMPEARVLTRDALRDIALQTYGGRAGIIDLLWVVLVMTVVMLAFTVSSAGSDEARREVGLLKALGFYTVDVLEIRMFESMVLSLLGVSLGVSTAIVYDFVLGAPPLAGYLLGWNLVLLNGGDTTDHHTLSIVHGLCGCNRSSAGGNGGPSVEECHHRAGHRA